jgi:hypothetical protein
MRTALNLDRIAEENFKFSWTRPLLKKPISYPIMLCRLNCRRKDGRRWQEPSS